MAETGFPVGLLAPDFGLAGPADRRSASWRDLLLKLPARSGLSLALLLQAHGWYETHVEALGDPIRGGRRPLQLSRRSLDSVV
jgi:hypothetical protein